MRRRVQTTLFNDSGDLVGAATVYILRAGADIVTGNTIPAAGSAAVTVRHPGSLKDTDDVSWLASTGVITYAGQLSISGDPTYSAGTWSVTIANSGAEAIIGANGRLVANWQDTDTYVTWYADDTVSSGTAGVTTTSSTGELEFYVDVADIDIYVTKTGETARYFTDLPVEGRGQVDVMEFGATGDGSTDDTNAIQAAIDYAGAVNSGGVVWFSNGTYNYTALIMRSGVTLKGESASGAILSHTAAGVAVDRGAQTGPIIRWHIRDLQLRFNSGTTFGLDFERFSRGTMERCYVLCADGFSGVAIQFGDGATYSAYYNQIISCDIAVDTTEAGTAVKITTSGNENSIWYSKIDNFSVAVDATGTSCNQIKVIGCSIENCASGVTSTDGAIKLGGTSGHVVAFNRFETAGNCIMIDAGSSVGRNYLTNNYYADVSGVQVQDNATTLPLFRTNDGEILVMKTPSLIEGGAFNTPLALNGYKLDLQGAYSTSATADHAFLVADDLSASSDSPEGTVTADFGSIITEITTGRVWVKETTDSSTGWARVKTEGSSSYAEMYMTTPAATGTITATTYLEIGGTVTAGLKSSDFTVATASGGRITYTGTETKVFRVSASFSATSTEASTIIRFRLAKDQVTDAKTEISRKLSATPSDEAAMSVSGLISLATDEYVELYCTLDTISGTDTIQVETLNMTVTEV